MTPRIERLHLETLKTKPLIREEVPMSHAWHSKPVPINSLGCGKKIQKDSESSWPNKRFLDRNQDREVENDNSLAMSELYTIQ